MSTIVKTYEWAEWVSTAEKSLESGSYGGTHGNESWTGASPKRAVTMAARDGYSEAIPETEAIVAAVEANVRADVTIETFQASWSVSGAEVDMSRYLAGVPECMIEAEPLRISGAGRAVRIAVPICYSGSVSADEIRRRGAAITALAGLLQQAGHPLEIWAGYATYAKRGSTSGDDRIALMVRVQRADEPFDIGRVMYAVAHPSMLRRLGFAIADTLPSGQRTTFGFRQSGGYGNGGKGFALHADDLDQAVGTTIIVPDNDRSNRWTISESVAWIEKQLEVIFS